MMLLQKQQKEGNRLLAIPFFSLALKNRGL
jgi:hypothetical protein